MDSLVYFPFKYIVKIANVAVMGATGMNGIECFLCFWVVRLRALHLDELQLMQIHHHSSELLRGIYEGVEACVLVIISNTMISVCHRNIVLATLSNDFHEYMYVFWKLGRYKTCLA